MGSHVDDLRGPSGRALRLPRSQGGSSARAPAGLLAARDRQLQRRPGRGDQRSLGSVQGEAGAFLLRRGGGVPRAPRPCRRRAARGGGSAPRRLLVGRPSRPVQPSRWPALRLRDGGLGVVHGARRLLPAGSLHGRSGAARRSPSTRSRTACSIGFNQPVDPSIATRPGSTFAQAWNYRYSSGYGSLEYSPRHPGVVGHDPLDDPFGPRPARRQDAVSGDPRRPAREPASPAARSRRRPGAASCTPPSTSWPRRSPTSRAINRSPRRSPPTRSSPTWRR